MISLLNKRRRKGLRTIMLELTLHEQAKVQAILHKQASELRMIASGRSKEEALELRLESDTLDNIADKVREAG